MVKRDRLQLWNPLGWTGPVWRSVETWPRRDSFLLAGLLVLVDYLLVAIFVVLDLNLAGRIALIVGTVPLLIYTVAEAAHGFRPTQTTLARADRLAVFAVGAVVFVSVAVLLASV